MTRRLTMFQVAGLVALQKAAGAGEAIRPKGIQNGTMHTLLALGLVALREAPRGRPSRARAYAATNMWRITNAGRAVLASPDPASVPVPVAVSTTPAPEARA